MAGRLPDTRRIRVVTARRGEFGDLEGERESLETKDRDRERMETSRARQENSTGLWTRKRKIKVSGGPI